MRAQPTIKDVAAAAGVSVATASMALRDTGRVAAGTRDHVKRTARGLGYRANPSARALRGARSGVLALTMPGVRPMPEMVVAVEYYLGLVGSAVATALEHDHALVVVPADPVGLGRIAVDGVVVVDPVAHDPLIEELDGRGIPIVTVGRPLGAREGRFPVVDSDFVAGTREVLDHLAARGARRPVLVACDPPDSFQQDSVDGYRAWCAEHRVEPVVRLARSEARDDADRAAAELLDSDVAFDAVHGTVDQLAESVLRAAAARGRDVPGDLLVSTCSDTELARHAAPPITTLDDRGREVGARVVERLLRAIGAPDDDPDLTVVPTDLLVRASTAGLRARAADRPR